MEILKKGDERIEFIPCGCGAMVTVKRHRPRGKDNERKLPVHLARLYYLKWKEEGFKEDKCDVED
jgi:hypothetical protein